MTAFLLTFYAGALFGFALGVAIMGMVRVGSGADGHIEMLAKENTRD